MCKISQYKNKYAFVSTSSEQGRKMKMNPENNKFLRLKPGVSTLSTDIVIVKLDPYFEEKNQTAYVTYTKITRRPIRIIQSYARQYGVDKNFQR